ncbi:hypothetical protein [Lysobacter sp. Hz 25]|uniref:hypothetical protein n=1 Tax=Lysobacter sp. Hz 25 TaxID=3383698 RepID=UPI0038D395F9
MSITRSSSTSDSDSAQRSESTRQTDKPREARREPPAEGTIDRFRSLMQQREGKLGQLPGQEGLAREEEAAAMLKKQAQEGGPGNAKADARRAAHAGEAHARTVAEHSRQHGRLEERNAGSGQEQGRQELASLPPAEASAMWQAQLAMRDAATQTQPSLPNSNAAAFADLIERHVRQLAVGEGAAGGEEGQVLLRLADSTLPGTDLLLTKTAEGWQLRADVRSRSSFDAIRDASPELMRRFASRNLGQLSIDPHFHD